MSNIKIVELQNIRASLAWTGSNESEFEDLLDVVGLTGSTSVSGSDLTVNWNAGSGHSSGSVIAYPNYTVYGALYGAGLEAVPNDTFDRAFRQVYP